MFCKPARLITPPSARKNKFSTLCADAVYTAVSVLEYNDGLTSPNWKLVMGTLTFCISYAFARQNVLSKAFLLSVAARLDFWL